MRSLKHLEWRVVVHWIGAILLGFGVGAIFMLLLGGCSVDTASLRAPAGAPQRGSGVGLDAGAPDAGAPDTGKDLGSAADLSVPDITPPADLGALDVLPSALDVVPDAVPVDVLPPTDTGTASDLRAPVEAPPVACSKLGPWTQPTAYPVPLPTTAYCFVLCPAERDPTALDYAWSCVGFGDAERSMQVNGRTVKCGEEPLPALLDGGWTFMLSPGGSANTFMQWSGALRACS